MLHDMGKPRLPDRVRFREDHFTPAEHKLYQSHVGHGVTLAKQLGLSANAALGISQHHEMEDGTGFPLGLKGDKIGPLAKILALVNRYDNLCNPGNPSGALTPHEALSLIFAQMKTRFDTTTLGAFIRMMGVYPPGSMVRLASGELGVVVRSGEKAHLPLVATLTNAAGESTPTSVLRDSANDAHAVVALLSPQAMPLA